MSLITQTVLAESQCAALQAPKSLRKRMDLRFHLRQGYTGQVRAVGNKGYEGESWWAKFLGGLDVLWRATIPQIQSFLSSMEAPANRSGIPTANKITFSAKVKKKRREKITAQWR